MSFVCLLITYFVIYLEQLLNIAVCQENPDFGERRRHLLKDREELEEKQANLQNQLLNDLIDSTGNILMDTVSKKYSQFITFQFICFIQALIIN